MKITLLTVLFLLMISLQGYTGDGNKTVTVNGYITSLQSVMFDSLSGPFLNDHILHNRLNIKARTGNHLVFEAGIRNRLFTGDLAETGSLYSTLTGTDQGWFDLSWNLMVRDAWFLNTTFDRLFFTFKQGQFEASAGRQRINWGQAFVWNPNDIFNAYSFFDFDYDERPGSDAIRLQYFSSYSSTLELAAKMNADNNLTVAALWRFNKWDFDIQFLAGYMNNADFVAGTGWSGNIGQLSFRGEATIFKPATKANGNKTLALVTAGLDQTMKDNSTAMIQVMYCNHPPELNDFSGLYYGTLSAKDLAFSKFTAFGQYTRAATDLLNIGVSAMWFPDLNGYYAGPSLEWSLAQNLDLSVYWQHFNMITLGLRTKINLGFLRFRYSF